MPPPESPQDPELRRELATMFLEDCPQSLESIRDALRRQDGPGLKLAAHTLKGSIGVFKDSAAFAAALSMEHLGRDADWANGPAAWERLLQETNRLSELLVAERAGAST